MPARTKRRAKFDFRSRPFVWWVDADRYLRISSLDKKFIIAHPLGTDPGDPPVIEVIGQEFPGLDRSERRPVWLVVPRPGGGGRGMGAWVDDLLRWAFGPARELIRHDSPPRFLWPMSRRYRYVGQERTKARVAAFPAGTPVGGTRDVLRWAQQAGQSFAPGDLLAATFVIDPQGRLLLADRHSEHVACAGGGDVLAAGEIFFAFDGGDVSVEEVSNQSTGYCPEPQSWEIVGRVLDDIGLGHPGGFTTVCVFRRCTHCGERNIVKDGWFVCDVCGRELDRQWNFDC